MVKATITHRRRVSQVAGSFISTPKIVAMASKLELLQTQSPQHIPKIAAASPPVLLKHIHR